MYGTVRQVFAREVNEMPTIYTVLLWWREFFLVLLMACDELDVKSDKNSGYTYVHVFWSLLTLRVGKSNFCQGLTPRALTTLCSCSREPRWTSGWVRRWARPTLKMASSEEYTKNRQKPFWSCRDTPKDLDTCSSLMIFADPYIFLQISVDRPCRDVQCRWQSRGSAGRSGQWWTDEPWGRGGANQRRESCTTSGWGRRCRRKSPSPADLASPLWDRGQRRGGRRSCCSPARTRRSSRCGSPRRRPWRRGGPTESPRCRWRQWTEVWWRGSRSGRCISVSGGRSEVWTDSAREWWRVSWRLTRRCWRSWPSWPFSDWKRSLSSA